MPERIRLRRVRGWKMPPNTVSVARPAAWGNPYRVGRDGDAAHCVRKFRDWLNLSRVRVRAAQRELRGENLACYCDLKSPCHADVLLEISNADCLAAPPP